jgi:hypothetical protein
MDSVMRLWCEFFRTKLNDDSGPEYFKTQGPLPDELLVVFIYWPMVCLEAMSLLAIANLVIGCK